MKYGLVERKRTTGKDNTSWLWKIEPIDNEDRVPEKEHKPNNSLFWYYPEGLTNKEILDIMLNKQREDLHDSIVWKKHTYKVSKESAERYLSRGLRAEDWDCTEKIPTNKDLLKQAEKDFEEWYTDHGNKLYNKDMKKAWIACFKKENFIDD
jgi:hypothetical protein